MIGRLAGRLDAIMASRAAFRHAAMVEAGNRPFARVVTILAVGLRPWVRGRLAFGAHRIVARGAACRRGFELSFEMAGFATDRSVPAGQRETRRKVIEILETTVGLGLSRYGQTAQAGEEDDQ